VKSVEDEAWYFNLAHTRCVGEEGQSVERSHCGCCVYTSIIFYLNINMYIYTYIYRYIYIHIYTIYIYIYIYKYTYIYTCI